MASIKTPLAFGATIAIPFSLFSERSKLRKTRMTLIPKPSSNLRLKDVTPRNLPLKTKHDPSNDFHQTVTKQKIMNVLKEADINKDGQFNKEELKHALKDLGAFFPGWRAKRAFKKVDANDDGQISGQEIGSLIEYLRSHGFGK